MTMPTLNDLKDYCGIDYTDGMVERNLARDLATAVATLKGAIGEDIEDVLPDDSRVAELVLIYGEDLYSKRGVLNEDSAKVSGSTRRMTNDLETQLRLEYRKAKEAGANGI